MDAPQVGLEPTTTRLTAECSAIELLRNPGRLQPSTFGTEGLNFCVRDGNRWDPFVMTTGNSMQFHVDLSINSRYPTTSLIKCQWRIPDPHPDNCTSSDFFLPLPIDLFSENCFSVKRLKSSPRPISIIKLHTLLRFHR